MRATVRTRGEAQAALNSVRGYPRLSVLLLIDAADLSLVGDVATLTPSVQWVGVELGNELDLTGLSAAQFGKFVSDGDAVLRAHGFEGDVISGGIYTVTNETLGYLQEAMQLMPADVVLGLHWYSDSGPALQATVQALAGQRRIAVTEFGMPSQDADQDAQQLAYLQQQLAAFQRLGATYALIYQLVSGPTTSANDNFGLQRYDGTWKPAAALLGRKP
jgi:exo-beta-1,3-glucanase (GH17 family)